MSVKIAWNVPMIALSVLDTFLSEGGLLSSSEGGDDDGVDGAVRERYEAEARWCVDELLAHMVDEKRVAVENIAPEGQSTAEAGPLHATYELEGLPPAPHWHGMAEVASTHARWAVAKFDDQRRSSHRFR